MTADPIWTSIAKTLRAEIANGARAPGDRLPTEAQLSARFGVNRHTVRRALARLSDEGLVRSRRGAGAFVASRPTDYPIGATVRYHRNLEAAGRLPSRRIALVETRPATEAEATALEIKTGAPVVTTEGVSLSDGHPLALFASVYPADRLPGIAAAFAETTSVTEALRRAGIADYTRRETRIAAVIADAVQAARLETAPGAALIRTESVSVGPAGQPVEYGRTHFVGERVTLTLDHS